MPKSFLRQQLNLSEAVEDYLKAIFLLREEEVAQGGADGRVTTNALAARLDVMPGSVTGMVKKLAELGLVTHTPYRGVALTTTGEQLALEIVRHHRLLELYLTRIVGFGWHEVHDQADVLEHAISEEFEDRIDRMLGSPTSDPHGDPIPSKQGFLTSPTMQSLAMLTADATREYCISRVLTQERDLLCFLDQHHLVPGARITLLAREPFGGSLRLRVQSSPVAVEGSFEAPFDAAAEVFISPHVASVVLVTPTMASSSQP